MAEEVGGVEVAEGFVPVIRAVDRLNGTMSQVVMAMEQAYGVNATGNGPAGAHPNAGQTSQSMLGQMLASAQARQRAVLTMGQTTSTQGSYGPSVDPGGSVPPAQRTVPVPQADPNAGQTRGGGFKAFGRRLAQETVGVRPDNSVDPRGAPGGGGRGMRPGEMGPGRGMIQSGRNVPLAGMVVAGIDDAVNEFQQQRQNNAYFQNIEGTDNIHGFGERWNEMLGDLTTGAMFGEGEYSDYYRSVTRLGYTDRSDGKYQSRQGAIDFAYNNKSAMGMDASESADYVAIAARSATTSFTQLSAVLQQVSKDAGQAGVNANMARQQMMSMIDFNLRAGMMGNGAVVNAANDVRFNTSMGRGYAQGVQNTSKYSTTMNAMVAGFNGLGYNQYFGMLSSNPAGAAQARQKFVEGSYGGVVTPQMKQWIKDEVGKIGGFQAAKENPEIAAPLFQQFLAAFPDGYWPAIQSMLEQFSGQKFESAEYAWLYMVQWVGGSDSNSQLVKDAEAAKVRTAGFTQVGVDAYGRMVLGQGDPGQTEGAVRDRLGRDNIRGSNSDAGNAYMDWAKSSGKRDPVIESLLTKMSETGVSQQNARVRVMTSSGMREVSLADAVRYFPDQVANGQAKFTNENMENKDVAQAFGITMDQSNERNAAALREQQDKTLGDKGTVYKSPTDAAKSGSSTNVNIGLTPEAAQFFRVASMNTTDGSVPPGALTDGSDPFVRQAWNSG